MHSKGFRGALVATVGVLAAIALSLTTGRASLDPAVQRDLGYATRTTWSVDGIPEIAAMEPTIHGVLTQTHVQYAGVDGQAVEGFYPGSNYVYAQAGGWITFFLYARDTATILPMARYYYGPSALRSTVEEILRQQYPDGSVSGTVGPAHQVDKATAVSDEETSTILAAAEAYDAVPDRSWLAGSLRGQPLIDRLDRAMDWLLRERRDPATGMIRRGNTTDWGDVKWEPSSNPTDMQPGDQWTASIYDQSIAYAALLNLARLDDAAGHAEAASRWRSEAVRIHDATNAALWQDAPDRGYFRMHVHLDPDAEPMPFDEGRIVSIGNAAAVYYGLADPDKVPRILAALERARLEAGAPKVGLTLQPPYDGWRESQMSPRVYQNGAIWDWWGGRQITGEFRSGYLQVALEHLVGVAGDWASHPGQVREWESPWLNRTGLDQSYAGAASVMGQAVIEGLFGVQLGPTEVNLTPRLGPRSGSVRAYEPGSDVYAAYRFEPSDEKVTLTYGSNVKGPVRIHLALPWEDDFRISLDDPDYLLVGEEDVGLERYAVILAPSGIHRLEVTRGSSPVEGSRPVRSAAGS